MWPMFPEKPAQRDDRDDGDRDLGGIDQPPSRKNLVVAQKLVELAPNDFAGPKPPKL